MTTIENWMDIKRWQNRKYDMYNWGVGICVMGCSIKAFCNWTSLLVALN